MIYFLFLFGTCMKRYVIRVYCFFLLWGAIIPISYAHFDVEKNRKKNNNRFTSSNLNISRVIFCVSFISKQSLRWAQKQEHNNNNNKQTNDLVLKSTCRTQINAAHSLCEMVYLREREKSEFQLPESFWMWLLCWFCVRCQNINDESRNEQK